VAPFDRDLDDRHPETFGARQHLDVEGEAGRHERLEQIRHDRGAERFQAALRVGARRETGRPQAEVEQPSTPAPPERLAYGDRRRGSGPRRECDVDTGLLDGCEHSLDLNGTGRQIGVDESGNCPTRQQQARSDGRPLAAVDR
jgi:hypothetical protein